MPQMPPTPSRRTVRRQSRPLLRTVRRTPASGTVLSWNPRPRSCPLCRMIVERIRNGRRQSSPPTPPRPFLQSGSGCNLRTRRPRLVILRPKPPRPRRTRRRGGEYGQLVTNPPYGERLLEKEEAEALYRAFGKALEDLPPKWRVIVLSSHTEFERCFGRPADKKRKLYNGMLKCDAFFYGR